MSREQPPPDLSSVRVELVSFEVSRPLRMAVLRPGDPPERPMHRREANPTTAHVAALGPAGEVLSVGSVMADPHPLDPSEGDWRLRGMATRPELRGLGLGALVLARCEQHAVEHGARRLWCNARIGALSFYERAGMSSEGEKFDIAGIGPHRLMSKLLP